jgi:bifunctional ADP-heptose synthase (sugar kinase/adenylyltransferase)
MIGAEVVKTAGGVVKSLPFVPGYATTAMIEKIKKMIS